MNLPRTVGGVDTPVPFVVNAIWSLYGSGGKSCRLAVRGLPVRSHLRRVEAGELVGTLHGSQSPLVCEWVNERHKLYSALDKGAI